MPVPLGSIRKGEKHQVFDYSVEINGNFAKACRHAAASLYYDLTHRQIQEDGRYIWVKDPLGEKIAQEILAQNKGGQAKNGSSANS